MDLDIKKFAEEATKAIDQAADVAAHAAKTGSEAAAKAAKTGTEAVVKAAVDGAAMIHDATQAAIKEANERKYTPLFLEEYESNDFDRPKLIVVSDEDERKGVEACVGAIGWMRRDLHPEVMHLYEEFIPKSGLDFYPRAVCDAAYFRDQFNPSRYINMRDFLSTARRDQMTELKQIARSLGAKECTLEYAQEMRASKSWNDKADLNAKFPMPKAPKKTMSAGTHQAGGSSRQETAKEEILFHQVFEGDATPVMPELKWYKDDSEILDLIKTRLDSDANKTKCYRVEINSFASMCMSSDQAMKIDTALGKTGLKGDFSIKKKYSSEVHKKMIFEVLF